MKNLQYTVQDFLAADEAYNVTWGTIPPAKAGQRHSHDFYELFLVQTGPVGHVVNQQIRQMDPGSLVFVRPSDDHFLRAPEHGPARIVNVIFKRETADHLASRYAGDLCGRYFWAEGDAPASYLLTQTQLARMAEAMEGLRTATKSLARIEAFLLTVMTRILDLPPLTTPVMPPWLLTALELAKDPDVFREGAAGFVRAAGRGHEHVCRKTREHLGVTPSALINQIRMDHAAHLLVDENREVGEVAENVGIDNMSHFYRVFRQHYGATPKAYRVQRQRSPF